MSNVDVSALKPGDRFLTVDSSVAEVLNPSEDGRWVKVRCTAGSYATGDTLNAEDLCSAEDIVRVLGNENCRAVAANAEGESLYCVLKHAHADDHVWRNAGCEHTEEDERLGLCEHDHDPAVD